MTKDTLETMREVPVEALTSRAEVLSELRTHIKLMPRRVDKPTADANTDMSLEDIEAWLAKAEKKFKAWVNVKAIQDEALTARSLPPSKTLAKQKEKLMDRVHDLENRVSAVRQKLAVAKRDAARVGKLEKRLLTIDRKLKDRPVLTRLVDAYGRKGLRIAVLRDASDRICTNLNRFAPLLFPERMTFSADVGDSGLGLNVERSDGRTSDIRHMSGAESRLFSLVWLLSVLPLVPDNRRSNLVVLDEFEANLDPATRTC